MRHIFLLLLWLFSLTSWGQELPFRNYASAMNSPSEQIHCIFFDKDGLMWLGTSAGVKSYDGYSFHSFRSTAYSPGILPNNTVYTIAEDKHDNLWLGTRNGLVRMNKRTGVFRTFHLPRDSQRIIYTLFTSKDGTLWIGTDGGLTYFIPQSETFFTYDKTNSFLVDASGKKTPMKHYSVKAITEDKNGDLLIGTWAAGLMRFHPGQNTFHRYPDLNERNSAYSLYFDKYHHLWIGSWGYGAIRMDNPDNIQHPQMHQYPYAANDFDTFYMFAEDPVTHTLWACTREGVCFLDTKDALMPWKKYRSIGNIPLNFCKGLVTDHQGNMWISTQNFGIIQVNTNPSPFKSHHLDKNNDLLTVNYINTLFTSDGRHFLLGLNPYGIALYDRTTGETLYNRSIPGFDQIPEKIFTTSVSSIVQRYNGEIWMANNNYGIIVKPVSSPAYVIDSYKVPYILDNFVDVLFESKDKTLWIGQRNGLSVVLPNGKGFLLDMKDGENDFSQCDVRGIMQDNKGNIWIATDNEGIISVSGKATNAKTLRYKQYAPTNGKFPIADAYNCLQDRYGRLWAISNSGGLFLYDQKKDAFVPKSMDYHLQSDRCFAINEDAYGNLWVTLENALARLSWGQVKDAQPEVTFFAKEDGLGDLLFTANSTYKHGNELYFGCHSGFFSLTPTKEFGKEMKQHVQLVITDLVIDDTSFTMLDMNLREKISGVTPSYAKRITLPSSVKKISVEFALLTYGNARKNVYAYKLKGYDNDWKYCSTGQHRATYQNLPSGTYTLQVKATDSHGNWQELSYALQIRVLPPWYASWWAYIIYFVLFSIFVLAIIRWYKGHLKTKNRLQMGVILSNITHELLTPLTIISASVYKLREQAPQYDDDYSLIQNNINRSTRLLRQILEVRKSQAGQLKLRVSKDDLASFVRMECENIRPMTIHNNISLSTTIPQGEISAWFDSDKLDKILYNLLSNAIKYNKENGTVNVSLMATKEFATIIVTDTGLGMSQHTLKNLYTRFLDGDYREARVSGTGIGMSLTHDLVKLHHAHIECQSVEGEGTTFTVTLPIRKGDYAPHEIDASNRKKWIDSQSVQEINETEHTNGNGISGMSLNVLPRKKETCKLLIVEDNEELLSLMQKVLGKNYQILTARNGKQALGIIQKEELDLVISDVMMPIMNGIELTQRIKEDRDFWQLPVILLTAKNRDEDKNEGYATGADAYITKPFKLEELEIRINTLIANRRKIREKFAKAAKKDASENTVAPQSAYSNPEQAFLEKAERTILEHIDDTEYDRDTFAQDMGMSGSSLYQKIKNATGMTVVAFTQSVRLQEARRIMDEEPDIFIADLALRVGFNTPKYFSRCFKKEYGMYPTEYAEELKKQRGEKK